MTLDEEMKLWEDRSNDEFGKILRAIKEIVKDYFLTEEDEYGLGGTMPLDTFIAEYALDGKRKRTYINVKNLLMLYDILDNNESVDNLMKELKDLI